MKFDATFDESLQLLSRQIDALLYRHAPLVSCHGQWQRGYYDQDCTTYHVRRGHRSRTRPIDSPQNLCST